MFLHDVVFVAVYVAALAVAIGTKVWVTWVVSAPATLPPQDEHAGRAGSQPEARAA